MGFAQYLTKNYIDLSVIIFIYLASLTVFVDAYDMSTPLGLFWSDLVMRFLQKFINLALF